MKNIQYLQKIEQSSDDLLISGHEMLIFESHICWDNITKWVLDQFSQQKKVLIFDDYPFLTSTILYNETKSYTNKLLKIFSIAKLYQIINTSGLKKFREIIRNHIWKAISDGIMGIVFLFNFTHSFESKKTYILGMERILKNITTKSIGFPIDCCCLYKSSLRSLDFAKLANIHKNHQIFNKDSKKKTQLPKPLQNETLYEIAQRSQSVNNSPFYFRKHNEVLGTVYDLEEFYILLNAVPLEVFCFHCYREIDSNQFGKTNKTASRSDIALWIQYSIGDDYLARQIYETIDKTLGTTKTLTKRSKFSQMNLHSSILRIIAERIIYLSTITSKL